MFDFFSKNRASIVSSLLTILIVTFIAFIPCLDNSFVNWDDNVYVTENPLITGLSPQKLKILFSSYCSGNYHPLTLLSYAVEYHFFGLNPRVFHTTNLVLHLLNCILVFWIIHLLSASLPVCIVTTLLFGLHPMRVESVAWISDRKDLLLCFFYVGALISYIHYLKRRTVLFYLLSLFLFILALLSKTVAVTLPLILLLLDYFYQRRPDRKMFIEKAPFFCMAVIFGVIAFAARDAYQAQLHERLIEFTLAESMSMGIYRMVFYYFFRIFAPFNVSSFYPNSFGTNILPESTLVFSSATILLAMAGLILLSTRHTRKIVFGSLFFFIALMPVFKVFNLGISADRFSYVPLIGIFYLAGEGYRFLYRKKIAAILLSTLLGVIIIFLSLHTWKSCYIWRDGLSLISEAIKNYPSVPALWYRRGNIYYIQQDYPRAVTDYSKTIELYPEHLDAYIYRGLSYGRQGDHRMAAADFTSAIEIDPNHKKAYLYRAVARCRLKNFEYAWEDIISVEALGGEVPSVLIRQLEKHAPRPEKENPDPQP